MSPGSDRCTYITGLYDWPVCWLYPEYMNIRCSDSPMTSQSADSTLNTWISCVLTLLIWLASMLTLPWICTWISCVHNDSVFCRSTSGDPALPNLSKFRDATLTGWNAIYYNIKLWPVSNVELVIKNRNPTCSPASPLGPNYVYFGGSIQYVSSHVSIGLCCLIDF